MDLKLIATDVLTQFEKVAEAARNALRAAPALRIDSLASVNTMTSAQTIKHIEKVNQANRESYQRLAIEPAIARVIVADECDKKSTYYICRANQGILGLNTVSYRAPIGRLASLTVGETFHCPGGAIVEVIERSLLHPTVVEQHWDSRNTTVEIRHLKKPITIESLRALLDEVPEAELARESTRKVACR